MIIGAMKMNSIVRRKCEGEKKYKKMELEGVHHALKTKRGEFQGESGQ